MKQPWIGILAFIFVLLLIPIGHALMVLAETVIPEYTLFIAFLLGLAGIALLIYGLPSSRHILTSTMLGFLAGILVWTGWVEFSFVWIAHKLNVAPQMENGEVATKPEYLVMMSSVGLLAFMLIFLLFSRTRCTFYRWFQRNLGLRDLISGVQNRPVAVTTFFETIMIVWTFYVLLLLAYDEDIAGTYHWFTYLVGFGSLLWSLFLIRNLLTIPTFDFAVRYAIPTVIIFWNFIEVLGRWNFLEEIWIDPLGHWVENTLILLTFVGFLLLMHKVKPPINLRNQDVIEK